MSTCTASEPLQASETLSAANAVMPPIPLETCAPCGPQAPAALPESVKTHLIAGTSTLGLGVMIERGVGFAANILAARLAGSALFGTYSLAISTANNISTYAAGGIGASAACFSGKHPYGSRGYGTLARALTIVSLVSASVAVVALWLGAHPIARLLGRPDLAGLLHWAALSSAGIIVLECARGFFVGQRRLAALLLLSLTVGAGMITLLPLAAAAHSPLRMIVSQGGTALAAVLLCLLLASRLGLRQPNPGSERLPLGPLPLAPMLRQVWSFGGVQLAGVVGSNLAGWWLLMLVARADLRLVEIGYFAIASQWRNLAGIVPGLLTEGSYAVMASDHEDATPQRVFALCSFASTTVAMLLAATGMVVLPWVLALLYGKAYAPASLTVAIALATAVVHMGNAPAAARLTIVSIRSTAVINTVWAGVVGAAATLFLLHGGTAWQAMAIYFGAHVLSAFLVLATLRAKDAVPSGLWSLFTLSASGCVTLVALAIARFALPTAAGLLTLAMLAVTLVLGALLTLLARRHRWNPAASVLRQLAARLPRRRQEVRHV